MGPRGAHPGCPRSGNIEGVARHRQRRRGLRARLGKQVPVVTGVRLVHACVLGADEAVDEVAVTRGQFLKPRPRAHAEHHDRMPPLAQGRERRTGIVKRPEPPVSPGHGVLLGRGQRDPGFSQGPCETPPGQVGERGELVHRGDPEHVLELLVPPGPGHAAGHVPAGRRQLAGHAGRIGQRPEHVKRHEHGQLPRLADYPRRGGRRSGRGTYRPDKAVSWKPPLMALVASAVLHPVK